MLLNSK
jgi:radial spoke head protein 4/6